MSESAATLLAIGITVPLLVLLVYLAFRYLIGSVRNVGRAVDDEVFRRRQLDATRAREAEGVRSAPTPRPQSASPASADLAAQVAAMFQAQAKQSDDAHKAQIRAHAGRAIPPIEDKGREQIERGRAARLAIKHIFPPRLPQRSMSYFGGLPIVPEDFDWPTLHNRQGLLERPNFMAQIDCSDLPPGLARDLLPDKGYLYFFAPMSETFGADAMHFVARYEPGPATKEWTPLDMPFTGKIPVDERMDVTWRGQRTHYDRIEVEFGWIVEPSDDEVAGRASEGHAYEIANVIRAEKLDAFYGAPPPLDERLSAHRAPRDTLWIPYAGFPINWRSARILRRLAEGYYQEEKADVAERLKALGDAGGDHPEAQRLRALQSALNSFSMKMSNAFFPTIDARIKEADAPPEEAKEKILQFLDDLRLNGMPSSKERRYGHQRLPAILNQWLAFAAVHGAEVGLIDPKGAALIAPEVVTALRHRHTARKHQMLGEGEVVQVAADDMKDRYLWLLQLGPDPALDWTVGEMGPLQYWITPEDLAAKRFQNTVLTIEAY